MALRVRSGVESIRDQELEGGNFIGSLGKISVTNAAATYDETTNMIELLREDPSIFNIKCLFYLIHASKEITEFLDNDDRISTLFL